MWGGKFGTKNTKIYGFWNPYVYEKDESGRTIWGDRWVATALSYQSEPDEHGIYWPAQDDIAGGQAGLYKVVREDGKFLAFDQETGEVNGVLSEPDATRCLKSEFITEENGWFRFICPCDMHVKYLKYAETATSHYKYYWNREKWTEDQLDGFNLKCPKVLLLN